MERPTSIETASGKKFAISLRSIYPLDQSNVPDNDQAYLIQRTFLLSYWLREHFSYLIGLENLCPNLGKIGRCNSCGTSFTPKGTLANTIGLAPDLRICCSNTACCAEADPRPKF